MKIFLTGLILTLFGLFLTQTILYPYYMVPIIIALFLFEALWVFVSLGQLIRLIYLRIIKKLSTYTEGAYAFIRFGLACLCSYLVFYTNFHDLKYVRLNNVQSVNGQTFYIYDATETFDSMYIFKCRVDLQKGILIQTLDDDYEMCLAEDVIIQIKQSKVLLLQKKNALTEHKQEKLSTLSELDLP